MADNTKEYRAAIEVVSGEVGHTAKINKLIKLLVNTEDEQLGKLLNKTIGAYRTGVTDLPLVNGPLVKYCRLQIATKKPQWQILAERHGWNPPQKS